MARAISSAYDIFREIWEDFDNFIYTSGTESSPTSLPNIYSTNFPPLNVWMNKNTKDLVLEYAVAGIPMENIDVQVDGDYIELHVKKTHESISDEYYLLNKGIKTGSTKNKYFVPSAKYNTSDIKAELINGILYLFIPSREEAKPKKVEISIGDNKDFKGFFLEEGKT